LLRRAVSDGTDLFRLPDLRISSTSAAEFIFSARWGVTVAKIQAEFVSLEKAEHAFRRILGEFESALDALEKNLEQTLAEWTGDAQRAYAEARACWDRSARELHAELAQLHKAIGRTHRNFRSSSGTNVRMWSE
jgi:WXG100 family type VII secretion target